MSYREIVCDDRGTPVVYESLVNFYKSIRYLDRRYFLYERGYSSGRLRCSFKRPFIALCLATSHKDPLSQWSRLRATASNEKRLKGASRLRREQWRKLVWVNVAENVEAVRTAFDSKERIDLPNKKSLARYRKRYI